MRKIYGILMCRVEATQALIKESVEYVQSRLLLQLVVDPMLTNKVL